MKSAMLTPFARGIVLFLTALTPLLTAANVKLYTADGEYQIVREYSVDGDRVKFYSVERGGWEEVPVSIVDLKRTEAESAARRQVTDKQDKQQEEEAAAARAERAELAKIPKDSGVYRIENGELRIFKAADYTVRTAKGRTVLQVITPIPILTGKSTVEIPGAYSQTALREARPEFYLQMDKQESFAIVKITTEKAIRIVEHVDIIPVSKEVVETRDAVQIFSKQLTGENFYKIWPQESLAKGEYAVIEFLEGKVDMRVWDFRIE